MIDISFEMNGKKVRPNQMKGALEKAMCQQLSQNLRDKLKNIRDPQTGEAPKIVMKGKSFDDLALEVSGSEQVIEEVKKRLGQQLKIFYVNGWWHHSFLSFKLLI